MAKKQTNKQAENAIKRNAPAEAKWLTQPTNITFMKGDMTLNQINTMIELVDTLQGKITEALNNNSKSVFVDKDYDAEGKVVVPVPFSAMTDDARRYQYYEDVARSLAETSVTIERVGDDGKPFTSIKPVINEARIPKSEAGYREGVIEFIIEKDMIETLFDINRYNRYIKSVAKNSKSVYTSRIYQFITAYKKLGVWKPKYEDLHLMFGFSTYKVDKETKERIWTPTKYPNYRQFKQKILKVAHDELFDLADKGEVDCYFEFSEEYPTAKKQGKPEKIVFTIITTKYGTEHDKSTEKTRKCIEIENKMKALGCLAVDIKQIIRLVDEDNADYCIAKIEEVNQYISQHKDKIENVRKYVTTSVKNAMDELIPTMEEVTPTEKAPVQSSFTFQEDAKLTYEDTALWEGVKKKHKDLQSLEGMSLIRDDMGLWIEVPSNTFIQLFKPEIDMVRQEIPEAKIRVKK